MLELVDLGFDRDWEDNTRSGRQMAQRYSDLLYSFYYNRIDIKSTGIFLCLDLHGCDRSVPDLCRLINQVGINWEKFGL